MVREVRAGRLSNEEREEILHVLGSYAQRRFDEIISMRDHGYQLDLLKGGLKYFTDVDNYQNEYFVEYDSEALNLIFNYFEYGTGHYNTESPGGYIYPVQKEALAFTIRHGQNSGDRIVTKRARGVQPIQMLTRVKAEMENNDEYNKQKARRLLGI